VTDCSIIEEEYRGISKIKSVPLLRFTVIVVVVVLFYFAVFWYMVTTTRARMWAG